MSGVTDATPAWFKDAACLGMPPGIFYTDEDGVRASAKQAKETCAECEVRSNCLEDAVARKEPHGIWGGMTPSQRERYTATRLVIHTSETYRRYGRRAS